MGLSPLLLGTATGAPRILDEDVLEATMDLLLATAAAPGALRRRRTCSFGGGNDRPRLEHSIFAFLRSTPRDLGVVRTAGSLLFRRRAVRTSAPHVEADLAVPYSSR